VSHWASTRLFGTMAPELHDSFGLWTHKGGVGKTTLAFHLSTFYAGMFDGETACMVNGPAPVVPRPVLPRREVIVVDVDPQANISEALLTKSVGEWTRGHSIGGSATPQRPAKYKRGNAHRKPGSEVVEALCETPVGIAKLPRNISGALTTMQRNLAEEDPRVFLIKVNDYNPNMPDNLWLLCGDYNLEAMDGSFQSGFDGTVKGLNNPFVDTALLLASFLKQCAHKMPNPTVAFIDCNPALTGYTKVALCASKKLVVPVNSDDFSAGAIKMMMRKLYNRFPVGDEHPFYEEMVTASYASKAKKFYKKLESFPELRVVVHNREAAIGQARGYKSLQTMRAGINARLHNELMVQAQEPIDSRIGNTIAVTPKAGMVGFTKDPQKGENMRVVLMSDDETNNVNTSQELFNTYYTCSLKDLMSVNIAATRLGLPIWEIQANLSLVKDLMENATIQPEQIRNAACAVAEVLKMVTDEPSLDHNGSILIA